LFCADRSPNPTLNAFLAVSRERALHAAGDIDRLATGGRPLPPLAGVPIGVKDFPGEEFPCNGGFPRILEGYQPPYHATVISHVQAAGAVVVGKLNCDEFAMGSSNADAWLSSLVSAFHNSF
jgi:aspartyl-tRNA(Asn)/glutamyl-tRNA(Gln) amidotransferase subunit A